MVEENRETGLTLRGVRVDRQKAKCVDEKYPEFMQVAAYGGHVPDHATKTFTTAVVLTLEIDDPWVIGSSIESCWESVRERYPDIYRQAVEQGWAR